ncbi:hypothetical protein Tco_0919211, partial [Tanacetum coccineum]
MVYLNFLREFLSTDVSYDPFPSTDKTEQHPLREFLIKFSVLNRQRPLTLDLNTFCSSTGLDYNNGVLSKKRKKPKSKRPPTETKESPPKPTEGSEQSHSVSSGTVPDPRDLERDIQLASIGLPSTLDKGNHPSKLCLRVLGNIPPDDMEPIHTPVADPSGTGAKYQPDTEPLQLQTFVDIQAYLLSKDELDKESDKEEVLVAGDDMDGDIQAAEEVQTSSPKQDQPEPSQVQESTSDSSSPDLKRFDNILPFTKRQLIKYLRKVSRVLCNRIAEKQ